MIVYLARPSHIAQELNCHARKQLHAPGDSQNHNHLLSVGLGVFKVSWDAYIYISNIRTTREGPNSRAAWSEAGVFPSD